MSDLTLYFDFEPGTAADPGQLADAVKSGLERLDEIRTAQASAAKSARITGLEILAAITLVAQLTKDVAAIAASVKKVIETVKGIRKDIKAKDVAIPVNGERKSIFALTDHDYTIIAEDLAYDQNA